MSSILPPIVQGIAVLVDAAFCLEMPVARELLPGLLEGLPWMTKQLRLLSACLPVHAIVWCKLVLLRGTFLQGMLSGTDQGKMWCHVGFGLLFVLF